MKINCSSLRCPYCGASKYSITNDDVFTCEYCNKSFNFNLEEIDFSSKNKVFIEELKSEFYSKVEEINVEKIKYKKMLIYYQKLSQPKKLVNLFLILLISSLSLLWAFIVNAETFKGVIWLAIFSTILNLGLFIFSKKQAKRKFEEYKPYVEFFAKKVVECQYQIDTYTKYISQLTK